MGVVASAAVARAVTSCQRRMSSAVVPVAITPLQQPRLPAPPPPLGLLCKRVPYAAAAAAAAAPALGHLPRAQRPPSRRRVAEFCYLLAIAASRWARWGGLHRPSQPAALAAAEDEQAEAMAVRGPCEVARRVPDRRRNS